MSQPSLQQAHERRPHAALIVAAPEPTRAPRTNDRHGDATVHPAGSHRAGVLRWGWFLLLNAVAAAVATACFLAVFHADGLDPYLGGAYRWLLAHPGATSFMAFSPLAASLLVGWGYAQRARRRKAAAARAQAG
jgi:hypothetical protein